MDAPARCTHAASATILEDPRDWGCIALFPGSRVDPALASPPTSAATSPSPRRSPFHCRLALASLPSSSSRRPILAPSPPTCLRRAHLQERRRAILGPAAGCLSCARARATLSCPAPAMAPARPFVAAISSSRAAPPLL
ncbi:hypothetical protein BS78_10G127200 [Paspalum vaginatum]|nr:hypothetical protein BS78_10G127200 [Paspalum vaginatum]